MKHQLIPNEIKYSHAIPPSMTCFMTPEELKVNGSKSEIRQPVVKRGSQDESLPFSQLNGD